MKTSTLLRRAAQTHAWQKAKSKGWLAALLLLLVSSPAAMAQLSGAYTINSASATGGTNYASFTAAVAALTTGGVSGPVTFAVSGGPYNEQISLGPITGTSATNRVTFNGGGRTIRFGSSVSAQRAVVTLSGADYVTLDNLVVDPTVGTSSIATYGWGIQLVNSSDYAVISNCTVTCSVITTSANYAGIVSSASTTSATGTGATASRNLTITGNTITGGYYGIVVVGSGTAATPTPGTVISNNTVRDNYLYGIYATYLGGAQLIGNDIARPTRGTVNSLYGIYLGAGVSSTAVEKNRIHQPFAAVPSTPNGAYGIYLTTGSAATATTPNDIVNNVVYDLDGNGTVYGIYNGTSRYARYYHNTIDLTNQANTSSNNAYGFYQSTGLGVEFRNNVVNVGRTGTGAGMNYAMYLDATTGTLTSNNNNLSGAGAFATGYYNGTAYPTLANWRTANSAAYDQASTGVAPQFVGLATGNLQPTANPLNNTAAPLTRVTDDITGAVRSTTPDMGAYEFAPVANDVALVSLDTPRLPVSAGVTPITVTVRNNGSAPLTSVRLEYVLNGGTVVGQTFTLAGSGLAPAATQALTFTATATLPFGSNTLAITASLPSGQPDGITSNNTLNATFYTAMGGNYTINSALPTGGTNYASFTAAVTALMAGGVSGPVNFAVSGGPYTEQVVIYQFLGASATSRVTFSGNGRTVQFGSANQNRRAVITLDGADFVTLDNLVVDATVGGTSTAITGWGVQMVNNADDNVVNNCTVTTSTQETSIFFAGIVSTADVSNINAYGALASQHLTITNNRVTGGYFGISVFGSDATATTGMVISNNTIRDFSDYGIFVGYLSGAQIIGNDISRPTRTVAAAYHGIHVDAGMRGTAVEKNRLHQSFGSAPTSGQDSYGIYVRTGSDASATSPNDFINNLVYDCNSTGSVYGFYNDGSDNARYYHNTVDISNQTNTNSSQGYGFYQASGGTGVEFRNNIVNVTRTGNAPNFGIYLESATGTTVSNNNNLTGGGNSFQTGFYAGTAYPTLANWQAANSSAFDQNSTAIVPQFVSLATGNLQPTLSTLNNTAAPLARVTDDILGTARATTPDMGAYEFSPATNDVALVNVASPAAPVAAGVQPLAVNIRNNGATTLTTVRLEYVFNGGAAITENFTLPGGLASGASRVLLFSTSVTIGAGNNTLTVTGSLPNGQTDADPTNNTLTTTISPALSGTYTINQQQPTAGTNFASYTAAATALNSAGIIGAVRFNVLNGPYVEQFSLGTIPGASATDTVVVDGGTAKQTLRYTGTATQPAAVLLNGTDFVTLNNLTIDASPGTVYGSGVHLVGQANNIRVSNCVITASMGSANAFINGGIVASGAITVSNTPGDANNLRLENNTISQGKYGILVTGLNNNRAMGLRVTGNTIRDFFETGISVENATGGRLIGNDISRPTRTVVITFTGILLVGNTATAVENNRMHDDFSAIPSSTAGTFGIYSRDNNGTAGNENDVVNNLFYNFTGAGQQYGIYNSGSSYMRYYHNTISIDNPLFVGSEQCYGFYQTATATNVEFRNNLVSVTRPGTGVRYALFLETTTSDVVSNHNDLYLGTGTNYYTGHYGTLDFLSLADWRAANAGAFDQNSLQVAPLFVAPATGNFLPAQSLLNGAGNPVTLARVPRDITGLLRTTPPDPGAYELTLMANDVAVVSIDAPTATAVLGSNPVVVTIRNSGASVLTSVTLTYLLSTGTTFTQTFTGLTLAAGASQQLTFSTALLVSVSGTFTLTVTSSLPNGQPDGNTTNDSQTITLTQPIVPNDEPCGAVALGAGPLTGSNIGATTSIQNGINLPSCAGGALPKDVWFAFTPSGTSTTLTLTGAPAGAVRVFTSPDCAAGLFNQVFCQGSGTNNTTLGSVTVTGLTAGQRYYVAVSGNGSGDATGTFTIAATALLGTRAQANTNALLVYPNPSSTGQLTLSLNGVRASGTVELLNALGQSVLRQPLVATAEQTLSTHGLAAGFYTLRVQAGGEVLTRKVVLQ